MNNVLFNVIWYVVFVVQVALIVYQVEAIRQVKLLLQELEALHVKSTMTWDNMRAASGVQTMLYKAVRELEDD